MLDRTERTKIMTPQQQLIKEQIKFNNKIQSKIISLDDGKNSKLISEYDLKTDLIAKHKSTIKERNLKLYLLQMGFGKKC